MIICHYMDVPFENSVYESVIKNNNTFGIGYYTKIILNNRQYSGYSFLQSMFNGELNKSENTVREEREAKWSEEDIANKKEVINIMGYDPFDGYLDEDRRFLFNELIKYFDDDIVEDTYKMSQVIQIVNNNNQIRQCDLIIARLNPVDNAKEIKELNEIKKNLVANNDKIAKENEISVRHRSNKEVGKSTLTFLMKSMREKDLNCIEVNYYDQLRSSGTLWAEEMSMRAIKQNTFFDENDQQEIFETQRQLILDLQHKLDEAEEKNRLLTIQLQEKKGGN